MCHCYTRPKLGFRSEMRLNCDNLFVPVNGGYLWQTLLASDPDHFKLGIGGERLALLAQRPPSARCIVDLPGS